MNASTYQQAIVQWLVDNHNAQPAKHLMVEAFAGAGKSTTITLLVDKLVELYGAKDFKCAVVMFNKKVADDMEKRLQKYGERIEVSTLHSLGYSIIRHVWGKVEVDAYKVNNIAKSLLSEARKADFIDTVVDIVNLTRSLNCALPENRPIEESEVEIFLQLLNERDIDCNSEHIREAVNVYQNSMKLAINGGKLIKWMGKKVGKKEVRVNHIIDFTDMLHLPLAKEMENGKFDFIFVDECQDLNAAQFALIKKFMHENTRLILVGDPNQAIYGFSGADYRAWETIKEELKADVLPLSLSYRCPNSTLDSARLLVPSIIGLDKEGKVNVVAEIDPQAKDMVLTRTNALAFRYALSALKEGKIVRVLGGDMAKILIRLLKKAVGDEQTSQYPAKISEYKEKQLEYMISKKFNKNSISAFLDKMEALEVLIAGLQYSTFKELEKGILALFEDNEKAIIFSTIHKAKGTEAEVVWLSTEKLPLIFDGASKDAIQQELNLCYVALTRHKKVLNIVGDLPAFKTALEIAQKMLD